MIKADIGCGTPDEWIPGEWIRVDAYVKHKEVMNAFAWKLPYQNRSVDLIWSAHMLEHLYKYQIIPTFKEWHRVLKPQGKIEIIVPDLAWCMQWWLDHQTNQWDMDIVFGGQSREGEAHHTGFNREIMIDYLKEAGFAVKKSEQRDTHSQKSLYFEAVKI